MEKVSAGRRRRMQKVSHSETIATISVANCNIFLAENAFVKLSSLKVTSMKYEFIVLDQFEKYFHD